MRTNVDTDVIYAERYSKPLYTWRIVVPSNNAILCVPTIIMRVFIKYS